MTAIKPRPVLSLADGVTRLLDALGAMACARAVGKSSGLIYRWADPDDDTKPSFLQAVALDRLWLAAGLGDPPPLLAAHAAQVRVPPAGAAAAGAADPRDLTMAIGVEYGELLAAVSQAAADGAICAADAARIARELRDMRGRSDALERRLMILAKRGDGA